jgi:dihydroorotase
VEKLVIKNGRVVDPANGLDHELDVLIENGKIARVGKVDVGGKKVIDAHGLLVTPGLIDMHVHFREPGRTDKESIETGMRSAVAGGFTSVATMANSQLACDNEAVIHFIRARAKEVGLCHVYPIGAVTKGLGGETLAELGIMAEAGAVAFSDDGMPIMNTQLMRRALEYAKMLNRPLIVHEEDKNLTQGAVMNEGARSLQLGLRGMPSVAEEIMVGRDVSLARYTGGRVHFAHVSGLESIELVRRAKREGVPVTAEATPHHLALTDAEMVRYDAKYKMNPPLRTETDVAALWEGVKDSTIDAIATDHAPHTLDEKEDELNASPFGVVGLETAVGAVLTYGVHKKKISLSRAIAAMTVNPARILAINKGALSEGSDADVTLIDPERRWTVDSSKFATRGRACAFEGLELMGKAVMTVVAGRIVYQDR